MFKKKGAGRTQGNEGGIGLRTDVYYLFSLQQQIVLAK